MLVGCSKHVTGEGHRFNCFNWVFFFPLKPDEVSRQCDGKHVFVDILDDGTLILDHVNASLLEPHLGRRYFLPTSATVIGSLCVGVVVASMPLLLWRSFQGEEAPLVWQCMIAC